MNDKPIAAVAGRIGRASTSELLVEKARLETAWIKETENIAKPYSLNLGICCREYVTIYCESYRLKLFYSPFLG